MTSINITKKKYLVLWECVMGTQERFAKAITFKLRPKSGAKDGGWSKAALWTEGKACMK